jgi:acyl carrier protein
MTHAQIDLNADELRAWMIKYISTVLEVPANPFPSAAMFDSYGFDSAEAVIMAGVMEEEFRVQIDPRLFFENPSVDELVEALKNTSLVAI